MKSKLITTMFMFPLRSVAPDLGSKDEDNTTIAQECPCVHLMF